MTIRMAINGFGRIGRMVLRAVYENQNSNIEIVGINDLAEPDQLARLLKYDSVHGQFICDVKPTEDAIIINGKAVPTFKERDPEDLPWKKLDVDVVVECTGFFLSRDLGSKHIKAGAKRVVLSAPPKDDTKIIVYGVNHNEITGDDLIVSNASCTTNALAPLVYTLDQAFGLKSGIMTTVHSYTGAQNLVDGVHKDAYRGRAAALSMIPTTTGATKAIGRVLPHLDGKLDGVSLRVPTPNVSAVDLCVVTDKTASADDVRNVFKKMADGKFKGIMEYVEEKLVSTDFNHNPHSTAFVPDQVLVTDDNLIRIFSWYDNEWGFSNRMINTATLLCSFI